MARILIDFDETLCQRWPAPGYRMGAPMPGAVLAMRQLAIGNELIVFTGRKVNIPTVYAAVQKWLDYFQIPYNAITNVKPEHYDLIVDNHAMHFDKWPLIMNRIRNLDWESYVHPPVEKPELLDLPEE